MSDTARRLSVFNVGIGSSAVQDFGGDPALRRAIHEELLEDLMIHGRLIFASQDHLSDFVAAVRQLPTSLSKAWETVLTSGRVTIGVIDPQKTPGIDNLMEPALLDERYADAMQLVLVETAQAEILGVPPEEFSAHSPEGLVEVGRLTTATRTATILAARQVLTAPLRHGASREDEWRERLRPLAINSRPIVIYDKYAGVKAARRYIYDRPQGDGLTWLLRHLSTVSGQKVRIITAVPFKSAPREPMDVEVVRRGLVELHRSLKNPLKMDIVLVPERTRDGDHIERFGHDRHIRFGQRAALALGMGVQSFSMKHFQETITVARLPIADARKREERQLRAALRPPPGGWWVDPAPEPEADQLSPPGTESSP